MATSGTYAYQPGVGQLILAAYARIGIRRSEVVTEHLFNAQNELNLMQATWSDLGPNLWTVDQVSIPLVQSTGTYTIPLETVMMLDVWVSTDNGDGTFTDRIITPFSRTEYASVPDKSQEGSVVSFWYDRGMTQNVTFWNVPDGTEDFVRYFRFTQIQDAQTIGGTTPQVPYLALDAYVAGLSHRLARIYAPDKEAAREADSVKAYGAMVNQLVENTPLYISPNTSSYWS